MNQFYMHKRVLVTGGAGFIGSHIVERLVALGAHVTVLDNLSTGSCDNLSAVLAQVTFLEGDITNEAICKDAVKDQDLIIHAAALVSVSASVQNPAQCHTINVNGTINVLEAARNAGIERCIIISSSAVYGNQTAPCHEQMLCAPTSPYGTSKLIGELYARQYASVYGMKTLSLRYFNVFGPRQHHKHPDSGVIARWHYLMTHNEPITILGDGTQRRDFIHVSKVAHLTLVCASLPDIYLDGSAINIASGTSISLLELLTILKKEFPHYNQPLLFAPGRPGDILLSAADCTKLTTLLTPTTRQIRKYMV